MTIQSALLRQPQISPSSFLPVPDRLQDVGQAVTPRRDRIWELSPNLHCSIIGTCLTTADLRQLFAKLNEPDAKTATDHALHSRAVLVAEQRDVAGKLLNRMLDKRHEAHIRRFSKARTTGEVRELWLAALERGDIPGAYWAVLTHPATNHALLQEVFGEVHMLSHLVGMSNRADIVRLRQLEGALGERDEKIARQEARLRRMGEEKSDLIRQLNERDIELRGRSLSQAGPAPNPEGDAVTALRRRLADEQARSAALAARISEQEQALHAKEELVREAEQQASALRHELAVLETTLAGMADTPQDGGEAALDLGGRRLLYVGGRPKQVDQLRAVASRFGGVLLCHDGGIEDNAALIPGLVSQADVAFFPVDCVSHAAAGQVKRFCRDAGKPFVPLRSASLASFVAALGTLQPATPQCACCS